MSLNTQSTRPPKSAGRPRLSLVRLVIVVGVAAALIALGTQWTMARVAESRAEPSNIWFAPYIDVTLTPTLHFEDPAEQPGSDVVLGFVVADSADSCLPSWGTYYSMDAAARALDLDRRIVRLRERGGDAIVSFGGAINDELATVCTDVDDLVAAYQSVIDRYAVTSIDFDIEGPAIGDVAANERRSQAIVRLQEENPDLKVWFTLPVAPHGMTPESTGLIDTALQGGVNIAGVNVMTMNYGGSRTAGVSMQEATLAALESTWRQLDEAYRRAGTPRTAAELWEMIGATPMIGQNDVPTDVFETSDARALVGLADELGLGRISMWSANRDVECGVVVDDQRASNTCSGVGQEALEFAQIFLSGASNGDAADAELLHAVELSESADTTTPATSRDDPATSPYPVWRTARVYEEGAKVVWQARVYQAKWWTEGDQPDAPVKEVWDTPWRYLGPVLEADAEALLEREPPVDGEYADWSAERVYVAGDEIAHEGSVFRARWWTQGVPPQEDPDQFYDHPWEYLGEEEPEDD